MKQNGMSFLNIIPAIIVHDIARWTSHSKKARHLSVKQLYLLQLYTVFLLTRNSVLQSGDCLRLLMSSAPRRAGRR